MTRFLPLLIIVAMLFSSGCGLKFKKLQAREVEESDPVAELMEQGNLAFRQEKYAEALSSFLQARSMDPKRKLVNYNVGAAYFNLENYPDAAKSFTEELVINNRDPFAYIFRGHTYAMMGLYEKATQDIEISLQLTDHAMSYYVQGLIHLEKGEYDLATNKFNIAIYKEPADFLFYRDRGKAYAAMEKMDKACADFKQALRIRPSLNLESEMADCPK